MHKFVGVLDKCEYFRGKSLLVHFKETTEPNVQINYTKNICCFHLL